MMILILPSLIWRRINSALKQNKNTLLAAVSHVWLSLSLNKPNHSVFSVSRWLPFANNKNRLPIVLPRYSMVAWIKSRHHLRVPVFISSIVWFILLCLWVCVATRLERVCEDRERSRTPFVSSIEMVRGGKKMRKLFSASYLEKQIREPLFNMYVYQRGRCVLSSLFSRRMIHSFIPALDLLLPGFSRLLVAFDSQQLLLFLLLGRRLPLFHFLYVEPPTFRIIGRTN